MLAKPGTTHCNPSNFPGRLIGRTPALTSEAIQVPILAGEPEIEWGRRC